MTKLNAFANVLAAATVAYYVAVEVERANADNANVAPSCARATRIAFSAMMDAQNAMAAEAQRIAMDAMQ